MFFFGEGVPVAGGLSTRIDSAGGAASKCFARSEAAGAAKPMVFGMGDFLEKQCMENEISIYPKIGGFYPPKWMVKIIENPIF